MNIAVFCSGNDVSENYVHAAQDVATRIAVAGHTLVWGAANTGLMKAICDSAQENGGKIIGVAFDKVKNYIRTNADEMVMAKDLHERNGILLQRGDAIIVLPGGLGTLSEGLEVLRLKKFGGHKKPVVFINTDGFFDGLKTQLRRMDREKCLTLSLDEIVNFADTPEDAMRYIEAHGN